MKRDWKVFEFVLNDVENECIPPKRSQSLLHRIKA